MIWVVWSYWKIVLSSSKNDAMNVVRLFFHHVEVSVIQQLAFHRNYKTQFCPAGCSFKTSDWLHPLDAFPQCFLVFSLSQDNDTPTLPSTSFKRTCQPYSVDTGSQGYFHISNRRECSNLLTIAICLFIIFLFAHKCSIQHI